MTTPAQTSTFSAWVHCLTDVFDSGLLLIGEDGQLSLANRRAGRLFQRDFDDLRADWPDLRRQIDQQVEGDLWRTGGEELPVELSVGDGRRHFLLEVVPVAEDDCNGHMIQIRDQEEVRRADRDLVMASQMHSISRLYRAMAHDLRSPLNAMVVNLELLGDAVASADADTALVERRRRYVRVLKEEMERLNRLLQAFLSQTSPATDGRRRFDLNALARDLRGFVLPQAKKQKTSIELELDDEAVESHGHADQIRSAVLSLMVNALQAVEDQDDGWVVLGVEANDGEAVVWVEDSGAGVPAEIRTEIFELHFSTRQGRSGIGLSVASRVAERHGGSLRLVETEGSGARFEMRLPRWRADAEQES